MPAFFFATTNNTKSTTEITASTADTVKPDSKPEPGDNIFSGKTDTDTILDKIIAARQKSKRAMITRVRYRMLSSRSG